MAGSEADRGTHAVVACPEFRSSLTLCASLPSPPPSSAIIAMWPVDAGRSKMAMPQDRDAKRCPKMPQSVAAESARVSRPGQLAAPFLRPTKALDSPRPEADHGAGLQLQRSPACSFCAGARAAQVLLGVTACVAANCVFHHWY